MSSSTVTIESLASAAISSILVGNPETFRTVVELGLLELLILFSSDFSVDRSDFISAILFKIMSADSVGKGTVPELSW